MIGCLVEGGPPPSTKHVKQGAISHTLLFIRFILIVFNAN